MPFTLSHAAAALPFRRTRLIFSAVVFGSFAPDFEYFIRFGPWGKFGHSTLGIFVFDLPASLIMLWLFHRYAKEPLWAWLPERVRQRVALGPRTLPLKSIGQIALVLVSILIGVITHIFWDSVTHSYYWPYYHWPLLSYTIQLPLLGPTLYFKFFQIASTFLGALVLLLWFVFWYRAATPIPRQNNPGYRHSERASLLVTSAIAIVAGAIRGWTGMRSAVNFNPLAVFLAEAVITTMSIFWLEVVIYGILRDIRSRRTQTA
ncbi:DUF4184 family protein [Terracidiphilus sp.]|uniref:DUF4184 family protein n=1 Tax=Terracidiphilus sp. TaxID=1964191 RepID=UPI003C14CFA7